MWRGLIKTPVKGLLGTVARSSLLIILGAGLMTFVCTGCAPTAEQIRSQKQANAGLDEAKRQAEKLRKDAWRSAGLERKEIQVDGDRIAYLEGGQGETVLLLHGYGADKDNWVAFAKLLTPHYHVVIPDLAGFGESTRKWGENYNIENQAKRIDGFADALRLKKLNVAGNSMGGAIAAVYAARFPQKVSTLALLDTYGLRTAKWTHFQSEMQNGRNLLLISSPGDFDNLLPYLFVTPPPIPAPAKLVMVDRMMAEKKFNEKIGWDLFHESLSLESFLPMIQAPVLIIWGDHDRILDVSAVPILEKGLAHHQTLVMKDTGHLPMLEKPGETAAAYISFLHDYKEPHRP